MESSCLKSKPHGELSLKINSLMKTDLCDKTFITIRVIYEILSGTCQVESKKITLKMLR